MNNRAFHRGGWALGAAVLLTLAPFAWAKYEREQVALETQLTQRIEGILSKTLPPNTYLVTVKVEMGDGGGGGVNRTSRTSGGGNPFMQKNKFVLPGVPEKKQFSTTPESTEESTVVTASADAIVKKISISILVASDVTADQIRSLREFISSAIPFNPLRGDELDIQPSPLIKPAVVPGSPSSSSSERSGGNSAGGGWLVNGNLPLLIVLMVVAIGLLGLTAFLFGPVRAFFNSLVAVLPRVGEQAALAGNNGNSAMPAATPENGTNIYPGFRNGAMPAEDNGPKLNMPFQFIREEQLSKLPLIFRELSSSEVALILAYLPPAWSSKLISSFDAQTQAAVTRELTKGREVPAEVVNQVEANLREKLPYMVGGKEWVQSIFPLTHPQTQRVLLNTLSQESPELAKSLRQKTFFFEDMGTLTAAALRILVQESGYPQVALALKEERKDFQESVLRRLPQAIRAIVEQELDLSVTDKNAITEAKNRLVLTARRLMTEGRIALGGAQ